MEKQPETSVLAKGKFMNLSSDTCIFRWFTCSIMVVVAPLFLLAACTSDEADTSQSASQEPPSCLTGVNDSNPSGFYSADDLAWFNVPGNFTQFASTCQTAAITAQIIGTQYNRGDFGTPDAIQAVAWWKKSAALGDAGAENLLGYAYSGFLPKAMLDDKQAFKWFSRGAAHGNEQAAENVALMYLKGQGVAADPSRAASSFLKFANTGDHYAQLELGYCYENGWGVPRDYSKAKYWFLKAWDNGCDACYDSRDELAKLGVSQPELQDATSESETDAQNSSQSAADWQQEHQAKIDELNQEIADHEQQAQQDDANADEAEAQVQQNESANTSGPGGAFLALGNAVQGGMNAGLAEKERQDAANERRQAQEEREQLAELGAEQPPVAQNNSETMALTQMQTQAIRSGNTIEGQMNRARTNIQNAQQDTAERSTQEQAVEQQREAQANSAANSGFSSNSANSGAASTGGDDHKLDYKVTYTEPAMNCLTYTAPGAYEGAGVWVTNSCSYEIMITSATPSAPASGMTYLDAGDKIFIEEKPVKVFACKVIKRNDKDALANMGINKPFDPALNQWVLPTYDDPSFVCPLYPEAP